MNAPATHMTAVSPGVELLLLTHPLIRILHGARKESYMRAWTRMALAEARKVIAQDPRALPENPRAALLALHEAVLELGEAIGIERIEFVHAFNARAESLERGMPEGISRCTERAMAMLALFCARRLERDL